VLDALPESHGTLLDFSPNMLEGTSTVLANYEGRYDTICGDFFSAIFPALHYDAVISSFALHHARGDDEYLKLYRQIRRWLKPGGVFACCDVVSGDTPRWTTLNEQGWKTYLRQVNFSEEQIEHIFTSYYVEDTPISLARHLALLHEAGFTHADVLWKQYNFAVYCAE
jgi:tRNA (cmo5U34)-methyltransferase